MTSKTAPLNIQELFQTAGDDGVLSPASLQTLNVVDIGAQIQEAMGVNVDDVAASEVLLLTMLIDDSGSIRFAGNTKAVRDGHNLVLEALDASKQNDSILAHTRYLNGDVLFAYRPLEKAVRMDSKNYNPVQGTPLYDETVVTLGAVLAKSQQFADNGVPVRTLTLIVTDGDDQHSRRASAAKVCGIVRDMLQQENHIVAAMGVDDGNTDFRLIFRGMGIQDQWILTPGNSQGEIRRAFQVFSQSAIRASQGAGGFSRTALGGFGKP